MKRILTVALLVICFVAPAKTFAQSTSDDVVESYREQGYFVRLELYGGLFAEAGYQVNPHIQFSVGFGMEFAESAVVPELLAGFRAYATEGKWTAFADYHLCLLILGNAGFANHRFTVGASYKNFDFGAGVGFASVDGENFFVPCLNVGYTFRFRNKR